MIKAVDLNSDLGESFGQWTMGNDDAVLEIVSSANIACGFHAGSPDGILKTLKAAKQHNVAIGAHVAYPDLVGFGRRNMDIASDELTADVIYQIGALQGLAKAVGLSVTYVKPHGALYNTIAHDKRQALAVIEAILAVDPQLTLVALAGSPLITLAKEKGLRVIAEAFADRAYHADGTLVSRKKEGAVLHDPELVAQRMLQLVQEGGVESIEGVFTAIEADSICVHGDSPDAVALAKSVKEILINHDVSIKPFAPLRLKNEVQK
ncbi:MULTISPECIES: LamB/YcsF family protein [Proteus]|uniref:LamB/YcsF family protein n=1 Tax=Proteus TaxID=583 RepID=UPI000D69E69F|nr:MULTISPECIES: 5-oxoprolinase subunit PxpA [Proteus]MBG5949710.1 LamB/YcsF family protein [Proteus terrae]MCE9840375.1 LamB/YcsF family protein [Proteus terrae]MCT8265248.1 LamB/YcsF family protein [Proteus terrae]NBN71860.1 5-oxoprolinase subunit PxpA [Proteus sp. G2618]